MSTTIKGRFEVISAGAHNSAGPKGTISKHTAVLVPMAGTVEGDGGTLESLHVETADEALAGKLKQGAMLDLKLEMIEVVVAPAEDAKSAPASTPTTPTNPTAPAVPVAPAAAAKSGKK